MDSLQIALKAIPKREERRLNCYGEAIEESKIALSDWASESAQDALRLFIATILLCLHEVDNCNLLVLPLGRISHIILPLPNEIAASVSLAMEKREGR